MREIKYTMDGDKWCAVGKGFIDLQVSIAGFGDTKEEALKDLILNEWTYRWKDDCTCGGYWEDEIKPMLINTLDLFLKKEEKEKTNQ